MAKWVEGAQGRLSTLSEVMPPRSSTAEPRWWRRRASTSERADRAVRPRAWCAVAGPGGAAKGRGEGANPTVSKRRILIVGGVGRMGVAAPARVQGGKGPIRQPDTTPRK